MLVDLVFFSLLKKCTKKSDFIVHIKIKIQLAYNFMMILKYDKCLEL